MDMKTDTNSLLGQLAEALASRRVRVIDLTQTLSPDFPQIALPPEMGQCWPFRIEQVSQYDERGPGWYWNNFSCGEHTGTHFDAPIHWISGRDLPNNSVDTIPLEHFVAPACVIDCSEQVKDDPDYLLSVEDIERFEATHGRIPAGAWLLMRTDWSKRAHDPEAYQNFDETCSSSSSNGRCSASAPRRSAPTRAKASICARRIRATTSCTARAATACSAWRTSICSPPPVRC
jgi:kynurenine formamidase